MAARAVTVTDVTKYRKQELALELINKELQEYKTAITTSTTISITDGNGKIVFVNDNFTKLTGYSSTELVGRSHNIINSGYHPISFWKQMWETVIKGETWQGEVCNKKKNGELFWAESFIVPVANSAGGIERIFSFRNDISERKNHQIEVVKLNERLLGINKQLRLSKIELEKLSLVAKLMVSLVMVLDKNGLIIWVNNAFVRSTGFSFEEAIGKTPAELLNMSNLLNEANMAIQEAVHGKKPFRTEIKQYSKTGKETYLISNGQPVLDESGNLLQYVIVESDITEMKEKQRLIEDSEIKLHSLFTSTTNHHILVDKNFIILAYNKVAKDFFDIQFHISIDEGEYFPSKLQPQIQEDFIKHVTTAIYEGVLVSDCVEIAFIDNNMVFQIEFSPAYDRGGNIIGCAFTAIDITEVKKTSDKIKKQNAILKEVAWKQSHIVRAPLANILAITNLLKGNIPDESLRSALMHEAEKLDGIIKDIVDKTVEAKTEY